MAITGTRPMTLVGMGHTKGTQCGTMPLLETDTKNTMVEAWLASPEPMKAHFIDQTMRERMIIAIVANIEILEVLGLARVTAMFRPSPELMLLHLNTRASSIRGPGKMSE